jgi:hypothetical protein
VTVNTGISFADGLVETDPESSGVFVNPTFSGTITASGAHLTASRAAIPAAMASIQRCGASGVSVAALTPTPEPETGGET